MQALGKLGVSFEAQARVLEAAQPTEDPKTGSSDSHGTLPKVPM